MPAKPRWLLAIPDAIRQLDALDRDLLTRRDLERLFGVSKVRAVALMTAFGAGRTGHLLTLPRAALLRQLRRHRTRAAVRGEATRRDRVVTAIRQARLTGIRVAVPSEALEARLSGLPAGVTVDPDRIEVRFGGAQDAVGRLFACLFTIGEEWALRWPSQAAPLVKRRLAGGGRTVCRHWRRSVPTRTCARSIASSSRRESLGRLRWSPSCAGSSCWPTCYSNRIAAGSPTGPGGTACRSSLHDRCLRGGRAWLRERL